MWPLYLMSLPENAPGSNAATHSGSRSRSVLWLVLVLGLHH